ncbi:MAG TPA: hypothetical protein VFE62_01415 [Gemmataceae bacterium]|nr:hypothetical protein [Gemmataceae bacterium]
MTNAQRTSTSLTFEGGSDFEAINKAEAFLKTAGFSCGSMQRGEPIGIMHGDYLISKWRGMTPPEREQLHGQITAETSFRSGPVHIDLYDDAPAEALAAFARAKEAV